MWLSKSSSTSQELYIIIWPPQLSSIKIILHFVNPATADGRIFLRTHIFPASSVSILWWCKRRWLSTVGNLMNGVGEIRNNPLFTDLLQSWISPGYIPWGLCAWPLGTARPLRGWSFTAAVHQISYIVLLEKALANRCRCDFPIIDEGQSLSKMFAWMNKY
jgi:hypothetical protein